MAQLAPPVSRTDAALNVGRELFHPDDDKGFGKWKNEILLSQLGRVKPKADDEIAAMWAASNPVIFEWVRNNSNARTVRGFHAEWKDIVSAAYAEEAKREAEIAREARR